MLLFYFFLWLQCFFKLIRTDAERYSLLDFWFIVNVSWFDLISVENDDEFFSLLLDCILWMHLEAVLSHLERVTHRILLHEQHLIELSSEEYGRIVNDRAPLPHAYHMVDSCPVEDLPSELTVASGNEHKLETGNVHLKEVL